MKINKKVSKKNEDTGKVTFTLTDFRRLKAGKDYIYMYSEEGLFLGSFAVEQWMFDEAKVIKNNKSTYILMPYQ